MTPYTHLRELVCTCTRTRPYRARIYEGHTVMSYGLAPSCGAKGVCPGAEKFLRLPVSRAGEMGPEEGTTVCTRHRDPPGVSTSRIYCACSVLHMYLARRSWDRHDDSSRVWAGVLKRQARVWMNVSYLWGAHV